MPKVGKHQLENDFFILPLFSKKEVGFQVFDEDVRNYERIHIAMFAMDFEDGITKKRRKEIENEWIEKLPTLDNVKDISIRHRVNQEFFEAICKMKNLESITFWSSNVEDLSSLRKLNKLISLRLSSFTKLTDISQIIEIKTLTNLAVESCFKINNYEEIGKMKQLIALCIDGDTFAPKNLILNSLEPFKSLKGLKHLDLTTTSIKDKSFLELLKLENLVRLDAGWRMKKEIRNKIKQEHESLKSGFFMVYDFDNHEFFEGIEWWID